MRMDISHFSLYVEVLIRLGAAMGLGMVLGIERAYAGKTAGMRTYALVSLGAALFSIISVLVSQMYAQGVVDPSRIAAQVVAGIGFLCAGLVIFHHERIQGLTTAAGVWVAAGIGIAAGYGFYGLAVIATILTLIVFTVVLWLEHPLRRDRQQDNPQ
jgi:putative Mg2+ transporter-C (MgtC) family protein